jgi:hypothetical protein
VRTQRFVALVVALAAAAVVLATLRRAFLGVDFADEAAYAALARRFLLGDRPFVDELNLIQGASFFTLPLVGLWTAATGGVDGLLLFLRLLYLLACAAVAWWIARRLRPGVGAPLAALVVVPVVAFVPLGIPTFSYNTLASLFFLAGAFLLLRAAAAEREGRRARTPWLLAGVALAWAAVAIPTYALPGAAALLAAVVHGGRASRARAIGLAACGALAGLAVLAPQLLGLDAETLAHGYAYTGGSGAWWTKLQTILWQAWRIVPAKPWVLPGVAAFVLLAALGLRAPATVVLAFVVGGLVPGRGSIDSSVHVFLVALLGAFVLPFARSEPLVAPLRSIVWLPSVLAALVAAWTSGNGIVNAGFGALPAALVTLYAAAAFARSGRAEPAATALGALVPLVLASAFVFEQRNVFQDDPPERLTARMRDGPFRGLYTTPEKQAWIEELSAALRAHAAGHERVVAVTHFPLAYLVTDLPPATRSTWGLACPPKADWDCVERFEQDLEHFDARSVLVLEVLRLPYSSSSVVEHPLGAVSRRVRERFAELRSGPGWTLFVPR